MEANKNELLGGIGNGIYIPKFVLENKNLSNEAVLLYGYLAKYPIYEGTMDDIERTLKIHSATRRKVIAELVDEKLITSKRTASGFMKLWVNGCRYVR